MVDLRIKLLTGGQMPKQGTADSAGFDLYACITDSDFIKNDMCIYASGLRGDVAFSIDRELLDSSFGRNYALIGPGETKVISVGFKMELPLGYEMQIRPRSGNSLKTKLRVANSPGTIDSGYRGDVGVILENVGDKPIIIFHGDRIAQGVVQEVPKVTLTKVKEVSETERGTGGFGSTGVR